MCVPVDAWIRNLIKLHDWHKEQQRESGSVFVTQFICSCQTIHPQKHSPTIHVHVRTIRSQEDRQAEAERMWREYKQEESNANEEGHGQTVYDLSPVTTVEYDVVACESFVEDKGAWVRHMPEEIRRANPHFVPS